MTASGEQASRWRQKGGEAANAQWHIWRAQHGPVDRLPSDMEVELREAFTAAFTAGARWSFVESAKLAPAIADLSEFLAWLQSHGEDDVRLLLGVANAAEQVDRLVSEFGLDAAVIGEAFTTLSNAVYDWSHTGIASLLR